MISKKLVEVLKFYNESGIDCSLDEQSEEYLPKIHNTIIDCQAKDHNNNSMCKDITTKDYITEAQELAQQCNSIAELKKAVESFDGCEIKKIAKNTVFSDGNYKAKIMLIGEAPGAKEDLEGRPFCGASGILLDKMLNSINLNRNSVYITNTVFWRPPGNRRPTSSEIALCQPFVEKHIALLLPKILILVGSTACYSLLKSEHSISKLRGKFYNYINQFLTQPIVTAILFHPAYLLRQPMQKRLAWEDLKKINEFIITNNICNNHSN